MKKSNIERREDGKFYAQKISICQCVGMIGNFYVLNCKIKQAGQDSYISSSNPEWIQKFYGSKTLWLSDEARLCAKTSIDAFEEERAQAKSGNYTEAVIMPGKFTAYFKHVSDDKYNCLMEVPLRKRMPQIELLAGCSFRTMLEEIISVLRFDPDKIYEPGARERMIGILEKPDEQIMNEHPLYNVAVRSNDIAVQRLIKLYGKLESLEECEWLEENVFRIKILPHLPKEFDRYYYVKEDTITEGLLYLSGYKIWHVPYFNMENKTHSAWRLNPCRKDGDDAVLYEKIDRAISFEEFLEIF